MSLRKQISLHAHTLTEMEKQFLRNLLENAKEFEPKSFTIENLAEYFNVSKTSVHRFTQKLGYDSFIYFRDDFFRKDDSHEMKEKWDDQYVEMLQHTYELVSSSITDNLLQKMIHANRITFYGMGMSNYLGKMFQIKLQLYGKIVEQYDDSRYMRLSAKNLVKGEDLVFVISRTGRPPEIVEAIVEASLRNIDIVLITEEPISPLGSLATDIIQTSFSQDSDQSIDTRINAHIALDILMNRFIEFKEKEALDYERNDSDLES
ncbi:MurR/RpiR family transcriptional regulator [Erysipelothrix inopinata]|uniref:MurR/RpiR family transcriptional regulator n=1 Tax=Erysipelothrix inopinata TaxID=225084 RepID=A0A7G9S1G4_9FIRM|nr:MurR/RpiR family transcriptional regulator [Erysipelothrix inopinata]QNN61689.1 MurR/RpiR family transcriptional regulator [Erysipelothrix inopinata]